MNKNHFLLLICSILFLTTRAQDNKKPISWQDIPSWEFIRINSSQISSNGQWAAFVSGPTQGDLNLSLKSVTDTTKYTYKIGGQSTPIAFTDDSKYIAFYQSPDYKEIKANEKAKKPTSKKLKLISLKDTVAVDFEKVQSFSFANENNDWLALRFEGTSTGPMMPGAPRPEASKGTDLVLYHIGNKNTINIGNVSDFKFNKSGQYLAYTVEAAGQNGNGIFLLDLKSGLTHVLQNDKATFSKITWNKEGTAFTLIKSKKDDKYKTPVFSLIGIKNIHSKKPNIYTYDGLTENQITAGHGISVNSTPYWSQDLNTIFFGIAKLEKSDKEQAKEEKEKKEREAAKDTTDNKSLALKDSVARDTIKSKTASAAKKPAAPAINKKDLEKPDMIIWNWQDKRLQSSQRTQLQRDKNYMAMSAWNIVSNKFTALSDSTLKSVTLSPNQKKGYGLDFDPYEYTSGLDGQRYADVYFVDIATGERTLALEKLYFNAMRGIYFSPNSDYILYYHDGDYYTLNVNTLAKHNLTQNIPASFVDQYSDHNIAKPATSNFSWTADGKFVLLKDNFDLWKVSLDGKTALSLTDKWKNKQITATAYSSIYPDDDYIDLKKDQYFNILNKENKQTGIALLAAGTNKLEILKLGDYSQSPIAKTKYANTFFYTVNESNKAPELLVSTQKSLTKETKLTENETSNKKYAQSAGVRLLTYVSDHGDTLQATLYLPADYEEGKSYPTITYIYERLTDQMNTYTQPGFPGAGFNRAVYNSNGYAVLMPDIKYKMNDPGMSAVACVVPAVKAAIATGIVDKENVAIHGHSWGGYQTSFLITQTDIFKAAVAGAPLTNMISMYSLIYWNSGSSNQSIFESSQGRLTSGYWDNWEAYSRNSPIYHIKKVNTPLVIMHNDKDGAVDYTQGIEYFNGLRRLNKPVVMLTYNGENHGLVKEVNKKDYAVRMMEYFDHFLKNKPAPDWWAKGIDYIDLPKHLEDRAF